MVCAVMTEPLPLVAQQKAWFLPCAAHIIQKNGTGPHPEAWDWGDVKSFREESLTWSEREMRTIYSLSYSEDVKVLFVPVC